MVASETCLEGSTVRMMVAVTLAIKTSTAHALKGKVNILSSLRDVIGNRVEIAWKIRVCKQRT